MVPTIFRMAMYHANHPNWNYETANRVQVFDPPHAISWEPGYDPGDGNLRSGGWIPRRSHLLGELLGGHPWSRLARCFCALSGFLVG